MRGTPPVSGGTSKIVWPYSETSTWSIEEVDRPASTMDWIWCRTAIAVVALESATDTSVHEGQRTSASMAAARCAAVCGDDAKTPAPITRATASTSSGRATWAHNGT